MVRADPNGANLGGYSALFGACVSGNLDTARCGAQPGGGWGGAGLSLTFSRVEGNVSDATTALFVSFWRTQTKPLTKAA